MEFLRGKVFLCLALAFGISLLQAGNSALFECVKNGDIGLLRQIALTEPSVFSVKDQCGNTCLHQAVMHGKAEEIIDVLMCTDLDPNALNMQGDTALILAVKMGDQERLIKRMLDLGANPNQKSTEGMTALHVAVIYNQLEAVRLLLGASADPEVADNKGWRTLYLAVEGGNAFIVRALLDKNADCNAPSSGCYYEKRYALHRAVQLGREEIVKLLLDAGAAVDDTCLAGGSFSLSAAAEAGHWAIVRLLLERIVLSDQRASLLFGLLRQAACSGNMELVDLLFRFGVVANAEKNQKTGPLHTAARRGRVRVIRRLLDEGACPNRRDESGYTAFHLALSHGHFEVAQILVDAGAGIAARGPQRRTALIIAARSGCVPILQLLLEEGKRRSCDIDIDERDARGHTALSKALLCRDAASRTKAACFFVDRGAEFTEKVTQRLGYKPQADLRQELLVRRQRRLSTVKRHWYEGYLIGQQKLPNDVARLVLELGLTQGEYKVIHGVLEKEDSVYAAVRSTLEGVVRNIEVRGLLDDMVNHIARDRHGQKRERYPTNARNTAPEKRSRRC